MAFYVLPTYYLQNKTINNVDSRKNTNMAK